MNLKELYNKKIKLEKKVNRIPKLKKQKKLAYSNMNELKENFKKESNDVEKMVNSSLKSYLTMFIGKYDETLEKEKREMIEAKLQYEKALMEYNSLKKELEKLKISKEKLMEIQYKYDKKVRESKNKLLNKNVNFKEKYNTLNERFKKLSQEIVEIQEAIAAGEVVLKKLNKAKATFNSAANWGVLDMVGGGLLTTMAKHNKINKGKDILNAVSYTLKDFNRELEDIEKSDYLDIDIDISDFLSFADYFFDGIFADFAVQSKINNTKYKIDKGILKIKDINDKLKRQKSKIEKKLDTKEKEIDKFIIKYISN